jgi:hypothetical protein
MSSNRKVGQLRRITDMAGAETATTSKEGSRTMPDPADPGYDPDRERTAYHEACHAKVALALGIGVTAVSLRLGERFRAATFFAPRRSRSRAASEDRITGLLAGDLHYLVGGLPLTGWIPPSDDEAAARAAVEQLARLPRRTREVMLAFEADSEGYSDADSAWHATSTLDEYDTQLIGAHLGYLTARASAIIRAHQRPIRALAERLYRDTVVSGAEAERIVTWWLCSCHREWGAGQRGLAPAL